MPVLSVFEKVVFSISTLGLAYPVIWYLERENEKYEKEIIAKMAKLREKLDLKEYQKK